MKKHALYAMPVLGLLILTGCGNKTANTTTPDTTAPAAVTEDQSATPSTLLDGTFAVNLDSSILRWEASKKVGSTHNGTVSLATGTLSMENGMPTAGSFVIDMNSITNEDLEDGTGLVNHLKSDDFFAVETHPEASFVINSVEEGTAGEFMLVGDLTIKGISNEVRIPATFREENGTVRANGVVEIDRTKWDIRYGSDSFFKGLGDNIINDTFTIEIELATK